MRTEGQGHSTAGEDGFMAVGSSSSSSSCLLGTDFCISKNRRSKREAGHASLQKRWREPSEAFVPLNLALGWFSSPRGRRGGGSLARRGQTCWRQALDGGARQSREGAGVLPHHAAVPAMTDTVWGARLDSGVAAGGDRAGDTGWKDGPSSTVEQKYNERLMEF